MKITINSCLEKAKKAEGIAVIIDVFRASNTIIACLERGADHIIPVIGLNEAYALKKKNPDHLLFGERKGIKPKDFDYGNSPYQASRLKLKRKKIILTTSAGSQGIVCATKADQILIGSFANAKNITDYIQDSNPKKVSLVAIGFKARKKADEDEECAHYIKENLLGHAPNFESIKRKLLKSDGANRLRRLNQEDDLNYSLKLDIHSIVPKYYSQIGRITI